MKRRDYEKVLCRISGRGNVIWLGAGLLRRYSRHVDDITRFVSPDTSRHCVTPIRPSENYEALRENIRPPSRRTTRSGNPLETIDLPCLLRSMSKGGACCELPNSLHRERSRAGAGVQ